MSMIFQTTTVELVKQILTANTKVLHGLFGIIEASGYFPPRLFLNEFLMHGSDPRDQDARMDSWTPFALSADDYSVVKIWWLQDHPDAIEDTLDENCWTDWMVKILEM
jgi:hypothetical protein